MKFEAPKDQRSFETLARSLAQEQNISLVLAVYGIMDELYAREAGNEANPKLACGAGCIGCCYQATTMAKDEWLEIERFVIEHGILTKLRKHINGLMAKWNQYFAANPVRAQNPITLAEDWMGRPCPFLSEATRSCTIYAVRPIVCRTHTSTVKCATQKIQGRVLYNSSQVEKWRYPWELWADQFLLEVDGHGDASRSNSVPLLWWIDNLKKNGRQQT